MDDVTYLDNGTVVFHCRMYKPYEQEYGNKCIRTYHKCPKYMIKKDMNARCNDNELVFYWTEYISYKQMENEWMK